MKRAIGITLSAGALALCLYLLAREKTIQEMPERPPDVQELSRVQNARQRAEKQLSPQLEALGLSFGAPIFIRIFKESEELEVFVAEPAGGRFRLLKTYQICTYSGDLGPKLEQEARQAPEGFYTVGRAAMNPQSNFHLAFDLGYPNGYDRAHGRTGDFLMVHGDCVSTGCYAMTDPIIEEIYSLADAALASGQTEFHVHCFPFRMTGERMADAVASASPWLAFWQNLKSGYDLFERDKVPPDFAVEDLTYTFGSGIR